jgi:hypothetical protein
MHKLIGISGMLAFIALIFAFVTGLMIFKFHVKQIKMKWHIWSAIAALVFATIHVALIMLH